MPSAEEAAQGAKRNEKRVGKGSGVGTSRLAGLFAEKPSEKPREWDEVDPRHMAWLVVVATRLSGAVTFGRSRDGQALMVTILLDNDRKTRWIAPGEEPETVLQFLAESLDTLT